MEENHERESNLLKKFFEQNPRAAIAYSGGVDSAFLLYFAKTHGERVKAYYAKSRFQPRFEYEDAMRLARELNAEVEVIELDVLKDERIAQNPENRCYFCKLAIMGEIKARAQKDGFEVLLDGTNASDDAGDRPGMKALGELCVKSPLRLCGLTKGEIRRLSKEAGLFTWDKPAYACLATRVPTGMGISMELLSRVEAAEEELMRLGLRDFRVRVTEGGRGAKLQLSQGDMDRFFKVAASGGCIASEGDGEAQSDCLHVNGGQASAEEADGEEGELGKHRHEKCGLEKCESEKYEPEKCGLEQGSKNLQESVISALKKHFDTIVLDLEVR